MSDTMNLTELLGKKLKDHEVLEVLESYAIEDVVYAFDRFDENTEDVYWASATAAGFLLRFNQEQVLDTIFCYIVANEGFTPISPDTVGAPIYQTFDEAEQACKDRGLRYSTSDSSKGRRDHKLWLRVLSPGYSPHYQFQDGTLFLVTLSLPES
jgi:hypothetical protein